MGEQQIFNVLIEFFEEDKWDFQWVEGMSILSMGYSGRSGKWICYAQARELQQQFVFYSVLPINVPEAQRHAIAELITRINYGMVIGNFELDYEDGEVRYKTSLDIEGSELTHQLIRQMVYANLIITDRYMPGIMRVMYGNISPIDALIEIEDIDDLDDYFDYGDDFDDEDFDDDDFNDFDDEDFDDDDFDDEDFDDDDFDDDYPFDYLDDGYDDAEDDHSNDSANETDENPDDADFKPFDDEDDPSTNGKHPS